MLGCSGPPAANRTEPEKGCGGATAAGKPAGQRSARPGGRTPDGPDPAERRRPRRGVSAFPATTCAQACGQGELSLLGRRGREEGTASDLTIPRAPGQPRSLQTLAASSHPGKARGPGQPPGPEPRLGLHPSHCPGDMSLLTNYEGLRHQIERLVRENEELKKLVRLIRENHELKSAIKTQAGGLGISGFSTGLGEVAATPPQCQGNCKRAGR